MKFLFFSPHTLIDSCSGAARCVQTMLEELMALGHQCLAVTGTMVDGKSHLFAQVLQTAPVQSVTIGGTDIQIPLRKMNFNGVEHLVLGAQDTKPGDFLAYEEAVLRLLFVENFEAVQPDVLITYGGYTSNFYAGQYAMAQGRKAVLFAASDSYQHWADFAHVNHVASVSKALTEKLARVTKHPIVTLQPFTNRSSFVATDRKPEYITFMNPSFDKGLKLATALALECLKRGKPYKFLFVESRATRATALRDCPELAGASNVFFAENIANTRAIYERARVILFPSLWFETAGLVAIEANANGVPVLASRIGGIPEMLDGAGYLFDPPAEMVQNRATPPPADYLAQWLRVLDRLHDDPTELADAERRAQAADGRYNAAALARRLVDALK